MADTKYSMSDFIIPEKISKKDKEFIETWIIEINNKKSLETSQKTLIDLLKKTDKSDSDIIVLKAFIKSEKFNYDNKNAGKFLAEKMDKDFISSFRKAISDKKMLTSQLSYKQALQKMIDDKVITNASLYTDFLKTSPDVQIEKSDDEVIQPENKSDDTEVTPDEKVTVTVKSSDDENTVPKTPSELENGDVESDTPF